MGDSDVPLTPRTAPSPSWMLENDIDGVLDLCFAEEADYFGR